jgi:hypothetical protein
MAVNRRLTKFDYFDMVPVGESHVAKEKLMAIWKYRAKKYLRDRGVIGVKTPLQWEADLGEKETLKVEAFTKSEARAKFKELLGVTILPPKFGKLIRKVSNASRNSRPTTSS